MPEPAVGIGGACMCIYRMEGPGGFQTFGRTIQVWNIWRRTKAFRDRPRLLDFFDQVRFFAVSSDELLDARRPSATVLIPCGSRRGCLTGLRETPGYWPNSPASTPSNSACKRPSRPSESGGGPRGWIGSSRRTSARRCPAICRTAALALQARFRAICGNFWPSRGGRR